MKYKVGDVVIIEKSNIESVSQYSGLTGTITEIDPDCNGYDYLVSTDKCKGGVWCKVRSLASTKIVVTTDGETTTARMFSGKTLVKSATAKCSKSDTFDFETGAALAVARLLDREQNVAPEVPEFPKEELQTGVFGCMSNGKWFVVVDGRFIYEDGGWDDLKQADRDGKLPYWGIDFLVKARSFRDARAATDDISDWQDCYWRRPGTKFDK